MYAFLFLKRLFVMTSVCLPHLFRSTKDEILKIKYITKSCISDSQESFIEIPNLYIDRRDHIR